MKRRLDGERVFVGLGANLGQPRAALQEALAALAALPDIRVLAASSFYGSAPVDAAGPDFVNAVAELRTPLEPADLLRALQAIEASHGRRRPYRNAPRTLDLDLLLHGSRVVQAPSLEVPHPRLHERAFVLLPLLEIAPDAVHPLLGPLAALVSGVAHQRIARLP